MNYSDNFFTHFVRLAGLFWVLDDKKKSSRTLTLILFLLTLLQIVVAVLITQWSADLFDALDKHSMSGLFTQVFLIILIFAGNIIVTVSHLNIKRRLQIEWREWLTQHLIARWMQAGKHYLVTHIKGEHDNPDGRIAEDVRIATESAIDMAHSLIYSLLMLCSFIIILWSLSGVITLNLFLIQVPIHGHLVWLALIYASTASILGWYIAKPLTSAANARQTAEANFRFALVDARENAQAIALIHSEKRERQYFNHLFNDIIHVWQRQTRAFEQIMSFTSGYSVLSMAFPILVAAPRYILGSITLGALVQSTQAFQYTISALSWPVDNTAKIAEWRASVERLLSLEQALDSLEAELKTNNGHIIHIEQSNENKLVLNDISLTKRNGDTVLKNFNATFILGERVLISGDNDAVTKLFRALLGCRPWGKGHILLPNAPLFFMPPKPYLPIGTLQAAIYYPCAEDMFNSNELINALELVELNELIPQLMQSDEWAKVLARETQQRLGLVRLLLAKPQWILLQESFDSLNPSDEEKAFRLICRNLPDASLLTISNSPSAMAFHHRRIVI